MYVGTYEEVLMIKREGSKARVPIYMQMVTAGRAILNVILEMKGSSSGIFVSHLFLFGLTVSP